MRVVRPASPMLSFSWGGVPSGLYSLYRGELMGLRPSGYTHTELTCAIGTESANATNDAGNYYFVVVGKCGLYESSYGRDSQTAERPVALLVCP